MAVSRRKGSRFRRRDEDLVPEGSELSLHRSRKQWARGRKGDMSKSVDVDPLRPNSVAREDLAIYDVYDNFEKE